MSGPTSCPALGPLLYVTIGPSMDDTLVRKAGFEAASAADDEAEALYEAAEGRGWKYSSRVNGCAISAEPIGFPVGPYKTLPSA